MRFKFSVQKESFSKTWVFWSTLSVAGVASLSSSPTDATWARPLSPTINTQSLELAAPVPLETILGSTTFGIDLGTEIQRQQVLKAAQNYLERWRGVVGRRSKVRSVASNSDNCSNLSPIEKVFCETPIGRTPAAAEADEKAKPTPKTKSELVQVLLNENWDAAEDVPYQTLVGGVGRIQSKTELLSLAKSLNSKRDCIGSKSATALAYQIEIHFPDREAIEAATSLYKYASQCGADFASAKASYRLGLLRIWQNQCSGTSELFKRVESNKEAQQFHARAKYWRAYCSEVNGDSEQSHEARESLLFEFPMSYHNLAANGRSDIATRWILREDSPYAAYRSIVHEELNPVVEAIEALIRIHGTDALGDFLEKRFNDISTLEPEVRLYLGAIFHKEDLVLPKFKLLSKLFADSPRMVTRETMKFFYPLKYWNVIRSESRDLNPLLVTALIRQESAFNHQARSRVGARGLMQLMPATAKSIRKIQTAKLFDPKTNVAIGTEYLKRKLEQYGGDVELTLAAYNAGFSKVDEWKHRYPTENKVLLLDLIPYKETREYVASILRNLYWYTQLYGPELENVSIEELKVPEVATQEQRGLAAEKSENLRAKPWAAVLKQVIEAKVSAQKTPVSF